MSWGFQEVSRKADSVVLIIRASLVQSSPTEAKDWTDFTRDSLNFLNGFCVTTVAIPAGEAIGLRGHPGSPGLLLFASGVSSFRIGNSLKGKQISQPCD